MNITDLIKEQAQMNEPTQPTPTEKSQIVIAYTFPQPTLILRFNSVKKGEKEYNALQKALTAWDAPWDPKKKQPSALHEVGGDMFISVINLAYVASISLVDHSKRAKFIPC